MAKKKTARAAKAAPARPAAKRELPVPRYLVLFDAPPSEEKQARAKATRDNRGSLASACEISEATVATREQAYLPDVAGAPALYLEHVGIGVADLSEGQRKKLLRTGGVREIVENKKRYALQYTSRPKQPGGFTGRMSRRPCGGTTRPPQPRGDIAHPAQPRGASTGDFINYMYGFRDGINALVGQLETQGAGAAATAYAPQAVVGNLTCGLALIGVTATRRHTGDGIRVAVLDTGIDFEHPDFQGRFTGVADPHLRSFVAGEDVADMHGHGTHCAGTIAGPLQSTGGVQYGVAPECELFVGKVLGPDGGYDSDILRAIDWAIENDCRIISMSLGSARDEDDQYPMAYEQVAYYENKRRGGALLVAAAGNESQRPYYVAPVGDPASCPTILSVAAVDCNESIAWFSSGQVGRVGLVNLAGPGVDTYSSLPASQGGFGYKSGTSMATPHVAGAAALWLQARPDLDTPWALWDQLSAGARQLTYAPPDVGRGLVQVPM